MKKWLVLLLSLALLLPLAASAQEVVNVYNWEDYIDEASWTSLKRKRASTSTTCALPPTRT